LERGEVKKLLNVCVYMNTERATPAPGDTDGERRTFVNDFRLVIKAPPLGGPGVPPVQPSLVAFESGRLVIHGISQLEQAAAAYVWFLRGILGGGSLPLLSF
jgi:hypothetical protein